MAYSGGLDTSIIIPWLKENYNNPEIIAVAGNVGQADELEGLEAKAHQATGASKLIVADLVDEMVEEVIIPSVKMDAKYENLSAGHRLCPSRHRQEAGGDRSGGRCRRHLPRRYRQGQRSGSVRAGHQAVRSQHARSSLPGESGTSSPGTRRSTMPRPINVPLKISRETNYSKDKNLWHLSHEGLDLEDPANEPNLRQARLPGDGRISHHGPRRAHLCDHRL